MFKSKIVYFVLFILMLYGLVPLSRAQSSSALPVITGPVSREPAVEKDGVRVALQTSILKKSQLKLLIKVSNLSSRPVLVSPDAVETATAEGFIIPAIEEKEVPANNHRHLKSQNTAWTTLSQVASLISFSDPYQIMASTKSLAELASQKASDFKETLSKSNSEHRQLQEVILQPGMATHGIIVYDASSLKAFNYAPTLHIKVTVDGEPFEFRFASQPLLAPANT